MTIIKKSTVTGPNPIKGMYRPSIASSNTQSDPKQILPNWKTQYSDLLARPSKSKLFSKLSKYKAMTFL